jgi:predicted RND superfamily exporter protein
MDHLATLFGRHRLLLASLVLVYSGICLFGILRLEFLHDTLELLQSDRVEFKWLGEQFGHLERTALIVIEGEGLLAPEGIEAIRKLAETARAVDGVEAVYSMLDLRGNRKVGRYLLPLLPSS